MGTDVRRRPLFAMQLGFTLLVCAFMFVPIVLSIILLTLGWMSFAKLPVTRLPTGSPASARG